MHDEINTVRKANSQRTRLMRAYRGSVGSPAVRRRARAGAGVIDLLDKTPPIVNISPVGRCQTDLSTYDTNGRRFYVNLKARF